MLEEGDKAPEFKLEDANGKPHSLKDFRGKKVVLYFYPEDDTPGCTIEACDFRDLDGEFARKNAVVIGVSRDDAKSHEKFREKYSLNFLLLCDPEHKLHEAYESWGPKTFMGKEFLGAKRNTFIIDEKGRIEKIFWKVIPLGHAKRVLESI